MTFRLTAVNCVIIGFVITNLIFLAVYEYKEGQLAELKQRNEEQLESAEQAHNRDVLKQKLALREKLASLKERVATLKDAQSPEREPKSFPLTKNAEFKRIQHLIGLLEVNHGKTNLGLFEQNPLPVVDNNIDLADDINWRPEICKKAIVKDLPKACIIIPVNSVSKGYGTIKSVLKRTPKELVSSIIVVTPEKTLEKWNVSSSHVTIVKNEAKGILAARNAGVKACENGHVLVFLDSGLRVLDGWLSPLLNQVKTNPNIVAVPFTDTIRNESPERVGPANPTLVGGFDTELSFKWKEVEGPADNHLSPQVRLKTPAIFGNAFAVSKTWYKLMGQRHPDYPDWGVQMLEFSIKTWLCGGEIYTLPCSRVAQRFKEFPYGFARLGGDTLAKQKAAIKLVWMQAKEAKQKADPKKVQQERDIKEKLRCKDFKWFASYIDTKL